MTQVLDRLSDGPAKRWLAKHLDHADEEFCLIWPFHLASNGYGQIGGARHIPHRIMCEYRHGPAPTPKHQAAHSCGKGHLGCVNPLHLNWRTPSENQCERHQQHGLQARTKLTPLQVDEIRSMKGRERIVDTAQRFNVSEANIRQIQAGKIWKLKSAARHDFTEEEVRLIRATPWQVKTARQFAKELGASHYAIQRIRAGSTYRYHENAGLGSELPSQESS